MSLNRIPISPKLVLLCTLIIMSVTLSAQNQKDSVIENATLENVLRYALENQPAVQQAQIDEQITEKAIQGKLADWFPQIGVSANYQRYIDLQYAVFNGEAIPLGVYNTSSAQLNATQTIFNRDVLLASSTASRLRIQSDQNTDRAKIDAVVNVTKAFYDALATAEQIRVNEQSIARLERSIKDAHSRYQSGVADKTDYKRATILLANAKVALKANQELLTVKQQNLKMLMGYPTQAPLNLQYDSLQMESEIAIDTLQELNYASHIDYKLLTTQIELQDANIRYSNWAFLPTLSAFGSYILNFQHNDFEQLYDRRFPYSYVGATLSFPIFQGGKRIANIKEQKFVKQRLDVSRVNLEKAIDSEYTRALAAYKTSLADYLAQRDNVALAEEVYDVIQLQYRNGIRTYLDVTIAESDLRTTRINYFNSLYQVLASKIDVQRALGQISY